MLQKLLLRLAKTDMPEIKVTCFLSIISLIGNESEEEAVVGHQGVTSRLNRKAEKVRIYCDCNYMRRITLSDIARHVNMNVSSFCKFFLRNFGCTFTDYINRLRVNSSCRLLKTTEDSVAEIAYSLGFNSVPYFNRIFLRLCGCTPSQYRSGNDM